MSANPRQLHRSSGWSDLRYVHDCVIDPNQSIHSRFLVLSNWFCAGTFYSVAKIFVWRSKMEKKLSPVTLPSHQHGCMASDCSFPTNWKEQESAGGFFFYFKQFFATAPACLLTQMIFISLKKIHYCLYGKKNHFLINFDLELREDQQVENPCVRATLVFLQWGGKLKKRRISFN